jgi:pimeloyl-ACP methyl ester carboxylesterase
MVGKGKPVVYFHVTASSSLEVLLLKDFAETANLRIIGVDRPGYGLSSYKTRKNLVDFGGDVNFLADSLGLERFGVLGWSGGGVFALAYLNSYPEHITNAVIAATPNLPFDISQAHNTPFARYIIKIPFIADFAMKNMSRQILKANNDINKFLKSRAGKQMLHAYSKEDLKFFSDPTWLTLLYRSMAEAFRQGNQGIKAVTEEHQIFMKPWNLDFPKILADKLFIWQGSDDKTCRVNNAYLISQKMVSAHLEVFQGKGHCVMFDNLNKLGALLFRD